MACDTFLSHHVRPCISFVVIKRRVGLAETAMAITSRKFRERKTVGARTLALCGHLPDARRGKRK